MENTCDLIYTSHQQCLSCSESILLFKFQEDICYVHQRKLSNVYFDGIIIHPWQYDCDTRCNCFGITIFIYGDVIPWHQTTTYHYNYHRCNFLIFNICFRSFNIFSNKLVLDSDFFNFFKFNCSFDITAPDIHCT